MKKSNRSIILAVIISVVFAFFTYRLAQMQLIEGESYLETAEKMTVKNVTITAARGEIRDRYGRALATNTVSYDVIFDKAFLPDEKLNSTIEKLITLLGKADEEWIDNLPITESEPFEFTDEETAVLVMKSKLGLNTYATVQNCLDEMTERFELEGYSGDIKRKIMGIRYEMLRKEYSYNNNYVFAEDVSEHTIAIVKENNFILQGVDINVSSKREYLSGTSMPHIIGTISSIYDGEYADLKEKGYKMSDKIGRSGIEKYFEDELKGVDGTKMIEQNSSGAVVSTTITDEPINGNTVKLTIDQKFQEDCQNLLEKYIKLQQEEQMNDTGYDCNAGAVVVMNTNTGEVISAATYPSYDMETYYNDYKSLESDTKNTPLFNRAISGAYRPGSTFKPAVALAGLASGTITNESMVNCQQEYTYFEDHVYTCLDYHSYLNVVSGLRESCNIFFYDVGRRVGIGTLNQYCEQLGLGVSTGIEIPENIGVLDGYTYRKKIGLPWYIGDVVQCSIGQGENKFSPLQLASYISTIANDGVRYSEHIIKEIDNYDGTKTISKTLPEILNVLDIGAQDVASVKQGMYQVVHDGTGKVVFDGFHIDVAGKTGTAQVGGGSENTLFVSFAPYEDPEITVVTVLEHGGFSRVNCYLAREIYEAYYKYRGTEYKSSETGILLN